MVVVTIVGILAVIGLVALRSRVFGSRSVEALAMIQSIRAAQERWRAENMTYLNVSSPATFYPARPSGRAKRSFHLPAGSGDANNWHLLNPTVTGPVEFGYMTNAGTPASPMTAPVVSVSGWPGWPTPKEHWYVIQAVCDADGDGVEAFFLASSLSGQVFRQDEGE
jgi:type II secretory pathway pseudopilin PulG